MPLVPILNELKKAQAGRYAVPLFVTFDMVATEGLFAALEEKRSPAMIAIYSGWLDRPSARGFARLIRTLAEQATVPVSLMLDHGANFEQCAKALAMGFTDIMFDGSQLPLAENIAQASWVVRAAHAAGAGVEAELGHVGSGSEYQSYGARGLGFTDPEVAERFAAETGVDILAVAIGTAHGVCQGEPHLDLPRLAEIRRRVNTPLSMHGGSGLSEEQFHAAIAGGIAKVNIFTDLGIRAGEAMQEAARSEKASYFSILDTMRQSFRERSGYYLDLFGSAGKA